jgi:hypothetical protein
MSHRSACAAQQEGSSPQDMENLGCFLKKYFGLAAVVNLPASAFASVNTSDGTITFNTAPFASSKFDVNEHVIPTAAVADSSSDSGGWYRARGWRGGRAPKQDLYPPSLTPCSWVNIEGGWYKVQHAEDQRRGGSPNQPDQRARGRDLRHPRRQVLIHTGRSDRRRLHSCYSMIALSGTSRRVNHAIKQTPGPFSTYTVRMKMVWATGRGRRATTVRLYLFRIAGRPLKAPRPRRLRCRARRAAAPR